MRKNWLSQRQVVYGVFLLFALIHLFIPIANHYHFKSFAYDYGVYNFAFYDFAHLRSSACPVYLSPFDIKFSQDHFSITLLVFAPFYWILSPVFGTYTLLIIQWLFVLLGAWATYKFIVFKSQNKLIGMAAMAYYFLVYGRFASYFSDCNLAIIGAAVVPVFFYFFHVKKKILTLISFSFLLTVREDFSLGMFFLCFLLAILFRKDKYQRTFSLILAAISILFFFIVFKYLIPLLENDQVKFSLFNYSALGKDPLEVAIYSIKHPLEVVKMLFMNQTNNPEGDYIKIEFYLVYLISGGFILLRKPVYLIAFIPLIAKKMFNDSMTRWGVDSYQTIEIASMLPVFVFSIISEIDKRNLRFVISVLVCVCTTVVTYHYIRGSTTRAYGLNKVDFTDKGFYMSNYNIKETHRVLNLIPEDASVCASERIVSHLAFRDRIFHFPKFSYSNFIIINTNDPPFPISRELFNETVNKLLNNKDWFLIEKSDDLYLFKRVTPI